MPMIAAMIIFIQFDEVMGMIIPKARCKQEMPGQATGGTRRLFLTVAIFRSWRGSKGFAAPGLPGRGQGYLMWEGVSTFDFFGGKG